MTTTSPVVIPPRAGRYLLTNRLGDGQLGPIFRGVDPESGQAAAVLFPGKGRCIEAAEARAVLGVCGDLLKLRHPGLVPLLDAGVEGAALFLAAEFAPGLSLSSVMKDGPALTVEKRLSILIQCSEALGLANGRGLVHGSLSPTKVTIAPDGAARIRQIGFHSLLSRYISRPLVRWGYPIYLSPEQVQGKECDPRSDVFSAGVLFYELMTGVHPFHDENGNRTLDRILNDDPPSIEEYLPEAPRGLSSLLRRCLEKNPLDRFADMEEVAAACRGVAEGLLSDSHVMLSELLSALRPLRAATAKRGVDPALCALLKDIEGLQSGGASADFATLDRLLSRLIEQYPVVREASGDLSTLDGPVSPVVVASPGGLESIPPPPPPSDVVESCPVSAAEAESLPEETCAQGPPPAEAAPAPDPAPACTAASPDEAPGMPPLRPVRAPAPTLQPPARVPASIVVPRRRVLPPFARAAVLLSVLLIVLAAYLVGGNSNAAFFKSVWSRDQVSESASSAAEPPAPAQVAAEEPAGTFRVPDSETRAAILVEEAESFRLAGKTSECRALLARALQLDPEHARALALVKELDGGSADDVALRDPALAKALVAVSNLMAVGQMPAAKASLDLLQRDYPGDPAVAAARRRWESRSAKEAREKLRKEQEQKDAAAARQKIEDDWTARVELLLREGRYSDASRDLVLWLGQNPGSSNAVSLRIRVDSAEKGLKAFDDAFKGKRYQEALAALSSVEQANPSDPMIAELRRKVEAGRSAARAFLTVRRLGPRGTLHLDGRQLGSEDEIESESIPAGNHMLVVRGESVGSVSRAIDPLDGQRIVLVYDLKRQLLRPMEESDQALLARRRASEEVHRFAVEHVHGVFRGTCKGELLVGLPDVEFKPAAGGHRLQHPYRQLNLKVDGRAVQLVDSRSGEEIVGLRAATPAQATELKQIWDRFKALAQ